MPSAPVVTRLGTGPAGATDPDHVKNTELLNAELPDRRFVDASYLHWLYDRNPLGPGIFGNVDDDDDADLRVAHYGLIPQRYRNADGPASFVFSLNAVTRSGAQRRGYFSEIGLRIWSQARDAGVQNIIGVTNNNSLKPVQKLGWRLLGPMVTKVLLPFPAPVHRVRHLPVTPATLGTAPFEAMIEGLDAVPASNWTNCWTPEYLRWRLASPNTSPYTIHADDAVFAVSTVSAFKGVPVAVILKLLPRGGRNGPVSGQAVVTAACAHHKAPFAIYAGYNRHVVVRGWRAPERLKPAPLNLMVCSLSDAVPQDTFRLDTFEFLDMDAY